MQDETKKPNVSDAELDALLAEWAEAEIEPPSGFHNEMMNRLRKEVQPKKKNNVVTLFTKNRRWTSIAAAAVLVLFCVPVVQGQLGSDATERMKDAEIQVQMAQNTDFNDKSNTNGSDTQQAEVNHSRAENTELSKANAVQPAQSSTETPDKKTVMSAVTIPEPAQNAEEDGIAVAQIPAEDEHMPMIAAFSLEEDIAATEGSQNARMAEEQPAAYSYRSELFDEDESLESLEQKLCDAEAMLAEYQALLAENPDDPEMQEMVAEQQKTVDELKLKIKEKKTENTAEQQVE